MQKPKVTLSPSLRGRVETPFVLARLQENPNHRRPTVKLRSLNGRMAQPEVWLLPRSRMKVP